MTTIDAIALVRITEGQQWDEATQSYVPLAWHRCDRCGRKHARIFEVQFADRTMRVGSACFVRLLEELPAEPMRRGMSQFAGHAIVRVNGAAERFERDTWEADD